MMYVVFRWLLRVIYRVLFRLKAVGLENVPREGSFILACNHISNFDPPTLGVLMPRKVHFWAKSELFKVPVFGSLIRSFGAVPVKRGGVSKEAIRTAIDLLQAGHVMGIFPEGTRNNTSGMAKKGAAMIALRSGAPIVPAAIVGDYRLLRRMHIYYGKPIDLSKAVDLEASDVLEQVTDVMMSSIQELKEQHGNKAS